MLHTPGIVALVYPSLHFAHLCAQLGCMLLYLVATPRHLLASSAAATTAAQLPQKVGTGRALHLPPPCFCPLSVQTSATSSNVASHITVQLDMLSLLRLLLVVTPKNRGQGFKSFLLSSLVQHAHATMQMQMLLAAAAAAVSRAVRKTAAPTMASVWLLKRWLAWASSTCMAWSASLSLSWHLLHRSVLTPSVYSPWNSGTHELRHS